MRMSSRDVPLDQLTNDPAIQKNMALFLMRLFARRGPDGRSVLSASPDWLNVPILPLHWES